VHAVTIVLTANCGGHAAVLCSHCYAELVYVTPKHAQAAAVTAASGRPELPVWDFILWRVAAHCAALMAVCLPGALNAQLNVSHNVSEFMV